MMSYGLHGMPIESQILKRNFQLIEPYSVNNLSNVNLQVIWSLSYATYTLSSMEFVGEPLHPQRYCYLLGRAIDLINFFELMIHFNC
jgi:hypothetical protein